MLKIVVLLCATLTTFARPTTKQRVNSTGSAKFLNLVRRTELSPACRERIARVIAANTCETSAKGTFYAYNNCDTPVLEFVCDGRCNNVTESFGSFQTTGFSANYLQANIDLYAKTNCMGNQIGMAQCDADVCYKVKDDVKNTRSFSCTVEEAMYKRGTVLPKSLHIVTTRL